MDKLLKPNNLDIPVSPNDSEAPATFKYWLGTVEKFLQEVEKKVEEVDKQALPINFLSPTVCRGPRYLRQCTRSAKSCLYQKEK